MMRKTDQNIDDLAELVVSVSQKIPLSRDLEALLQEVDCAQMRGYFLPDEDVRLRDCYLYYLRVRGVLLGVVDMLIPTAYQKEDGSGCAKAFVTGFTAACVLMRASDFIVRLAGDRFTVWKKLDEPEPRCGVERGSFTKIYKNLASPRRAWRFFQAVAFFEGHQGEMCSLRDAGGVWAELINVLDVEWPLINKSKSAFLQRRLRYQLFSFKRRNHAGYKKVMFHLFSLGGSVISELKQPHLAMVKHGKRVTPRVLAKAWSILLPGDVIVTRHDEAVSNLFLPGFWPHAALYIGSAEQRRELRLDFEVPDGVEVVEAKKDGVRYRRLLETLSVDAFTVIRPLLTPELVAQAIANACTHVGKRYDFLFDFRQADRLACTAVVYRAYHAVGSARFELREVSGRLCLPAESLLDQAISSGVFEPVAIYGVKGVKVQVGDLAKQRLRESYASCW